MIYIIKENRTYDQVLGDVARGNGDASLCIFGEDVSPNQHKLADQFVLLDNTYCSGILSADGHQWCTTAFTTDYMEKSFAGFPRSYPDGLGIDENDALAYSPAGFIWDNALKHKKTIRNYGEFMSPSKPMSAGGTPHVKARPNPSTATALGRARQTSWYSISIHRSRRYAHSLRPISSAGICPCPTSIGPTSFSTNCANLKSRESFRTSCSFACSTIIPAGTSPGYPTPRALRGRQRSRVRPDRRRPQPLQVLEGNGHLCHRRRSASRLGPRERLSNGRFLHQSLRETQAVVVSTQYNTTSIMRTIEQILGLPPMNQFDASATPMFDCFTDEPDFAPFVVVAIQHPARRDESRTDSHRRPRPAIGRRGFFESSIFGRSIRRRRMC